MQIICKNDSYVFEFPCGDRLYVLDDDVERSRPLRDMIVGAATSGETTIPFPSSVELSHFHIWAAAVQPDSPVFQADAETTHRSLEVCFCTFTQYLYSSTSHPALHIQNYGGDKQIQPQALNLVKAQFQNACRGFSCR